MREEFMGIRPFKVNVPETALLDLRTRISKTRWPDEIEGSGWKYGASLSYINELAAYWENVFDWRRIEESINLLPNFIAELDGYNVHFLHVRGTGKQPVPLILTHGWPGSFLEFMKLIPLLTNHGEPTFDLVIPSLLGYAFSQRVVSPGGNIQLMAEVWHKLMRSLHYEKFGAHGGDFGSGVSTALASRFQGSVIGLHLNNIEGYWTPYLPEGEKLTQPEIDSLKDADDWYEREGGYSHEQGTRPLTLAYGLNDSPVGLCAWMVEKFFAWSDCRGNIENAFTKDDLLANVTLYWLTGSIHSSFRLYNECRNSPLHFGKTDFIRAPVAIARFPLEDPFPPRRYIERGYNVQRWTNMPAGGHFASMEQPDLLADDIRTFFGGLMT
jgi:pimeloyl-ACP methyl ester carboxylesterase